MANHLKMAIVESIVTLYERGWSKRQIARELGLDRETVARHLRLAGESKPANAPIGLSEAAAESKPASAHIVAQTAAEGSKPAIVPIGFGDAASESKPAIAPIGSDGADANASGSRGAGRPSVCEPHRQAILAWLDQGLTAQRIYQDLVREHGFAGSYYSVRRFVRRFEHRTELPMRRMECAAGEEVQVDFGSGAPIVAADGSRRRPHVFRVVLSHSRKGYSEAVLRQTTESFLRCLENAFVHFGGVPQRVVLDNLRAAVTQADWFDPDLNPKVLSFAQHYGTVFLPTKPRTPRHKGKIERGVGYVKANALKGRTFASLDEQNQFLLEWEQNVADTRVHGTTRRQVGKLFAEVEQAALLPLPMTRFPCFREGQRTVNRDGHVEVERAYYSAPPEYLGRRVWVRWDGRLVRLFNQRFEQLAVHVQREPGRFSTHEQHIPAEKISGVERGTTWMLERICLVGPHAARWAEGVLETRGVEGVRVLQGLLSLAKRHHVDQIERACDIAQSYGAYRLRTLRQLIDRDQPKQQQFAFMDEHPLIRPLSEYQQFVHDAFQKGASS
jgi:transposase